MGKKMQLTRGLKGIEVFGEQGKPAKAKHNYLTF